MIAYKGNFTGKGRESVIIETGIGYRVCSFNGIGKSEPDRRGGKGAYIYACT